MKCMVKFRTLSSGQLMIHSALYISHSAGKGRGVFSSEDIDTGIVIESSPVIVLSGEERKWLDQTLLHDYIFEWGLKKEQCCMALGYLAIYNHALDCNCDYEMDFDAREIRIKTISPVRAGEELFINYNGERNNNKPLWFDAK